MFINMQSYPSFDPLRFRSKYPQHSVLKIPLYIFPLIFLYNNADKKDSQVRMDQKTTNEI